MVHAILNRLVERIRLEGNMHHGTHALELSSKATKEASETHTRTHAHTHTQKDHAGARVSL